MYTPLPQERLIESIFWKVFFPFICVVALWPIYYFTNLAHPFQKTFAHCELLIYSTILMLEVYIGIIHMGDKRSIGMYVFQNLALLLSICFVFVFGFLKFQAIITETDVIKFELNNDLAGAQLLGLRLVTLSCINCSVAVLSVIFSIFIFYQIKNIEYGKEIEKLNSPSPPLP